MLIVTKKCENDYKQSFDAQGSLELYVESVSIKGNDLTLHRQNDMLDFHLCFYAGCM